MTDTQKILDLAYAQIKEKLPDFSPADLNALIKTLHGVKKEEVLEAPSTNISSFLAKHKK